MELYNKEFVYFDWDDKLEGKKVMVSDDIYKLKRYVNGEEINTYDVSKSSNNQYPFLVSGTAFRFCYYDPNYEVKRTLLEGGVVQYYREEFDKWTDLNLSSSAEDYLDSEDWDIYEWRIKPIEWHVVLSGDGSALGITTTPDKHVYFTGTDDECSKWIDEHKHLVDVMVAWEDGRIIQFHSVMSNDWLDCENEPAWDSEATIYRIKPYEYEPFETLDELISKWESMNPGCTNRPKCTMPMIWVKDKFGSCIYLITGYDENDKNPIMVNDIWISLKDLFDYYRFINDSIIGKRG